MTFIHQRTTGLSGAGGGGGPLLDYTPDGILNVNDLGLADGIEQLGLSYAAPVYLTGLRRDLMSDS